MKLYHITHDGHYLGGISIVLAPNEERALHLLKLELSNYGINHLDIFSIKEIDLTKEAAHVMFSGDY